MSAQNEFFWEKLAKPFGTMLETSSFPLEAQCKFLIFVYARVLGMMGPHYAYGTGSLMTIDGSPVELSWVIPRKRPTLGSINRQVRFAIEPIDPRTGKPLNGSTVLDYLVSPEGSLGVVVCEEDGMSWRRETEKFLFPEDTGSDIPEGTRFFVGFDFSSCGTLTLKAYYIPAPCPTTLSLSNERTRPIHLWDTELDPLRKLLGQLDSRLMKPLELLLSYFEGLDEENRPRIQIFALDCVRGNANRLKIYCRPKKGTSWEDAKRAFTLGGSLSGPHVDSVVSKMEILWNNLFPASSSSSNKDLHIKNWDINPSADGNGIKLTTAQHPIGGLLYYYSLYAGSDSIFPKIYLPVAHYCPNDAFITEAIEKFYSHESIRIDGPPQGSHGPGWVTREVANVFNDRDLSAKSGTHTYVTFGLKTSGWDLTSYFSPDIWS
ncbi:aromatic prenyltransferase [Cyathus striatus]|nr:aromatic prenyltransferase [Cyathus striatus]